MIAMQEDTQQEKLLTLQEVAIRLRISPETVKRIIKAGKLTGVRVGGRIRVKARSLDDYIARNIIQPEEK